MQKLLCTVTLLLVGAISAVGLYFVREIEGFPEKIMLIYWPAEFVWKQLQYEVGRGTIRTIMNNVAVFGILAGIEGAIVGMILDLYLSQRRAALRRQVGYLPYSKGPLDPAFKRRVEEIVAKYDPADLIKSSSEENYRPQAEMILANLKKLGSAKQLHKFCRRHFRQHFGRDTAKAFGEYESLTGDIWGEYQRLLSAPRRQPPRSPGM